MRNELNVILVEDEPEECRHIIEYAETIGNIKIIAVTNSAEKAVEYIYEYIPDAVILDLELNKGTGDGLLFLSKLRQNKPVKMPYVLVTTNNVSDITYERARNLGADFIISKHKTDYTEKTAVDFLHSMRTTIINSFELKKNLQKESENVEEEINEAKIINRISSEFNYIGISPRAIGRKYLVDAILLMINGTRKNLCEVIAKEYGVTSSSVERAMQNAIKRAWRNTPIEDLSFYYTARISSAKGVPMMMEFIHYYAEKVTHM